MYVLKLAWVIPMSDILFLLWGDQKIRYEQNTTSAVNATVHTMCVRGKQFKLDSTWFSKIRIGRVKEGSW